MWRCVQLLILFLAGIWIVPGNCTDTCVDTFEEFPNMHANGAQGVPNIKDLETCLQKCLRSRSCRAVDWNTSPTPWRNVRCWFYLSEMTQIMPHGSYDHYVRRPCDQLKETEKRRVIGPGLAERPYANSTHGEAKVMIMRYPIDVRGTIHEWRYHYAGGLDDSVAGNPNVGLLIIRPYGHHAYKMVGYYHAHESLHGINIVSGLFPLLGHSKVQPGDALAYVASTSENAAISYDFGDEESCGRTYSFEVEDMNTLMIVPADDLIRDPRCMVLSFELEIILD